MYCLRHVLLAVAVLCLSESVIRGDDNKYLYANEADLIAPYTGWLLIGIKRVKCGCTLIAPNWAMTAATCAGSDIVSVNFGDTNREVNEGTEQVFTVEASFSHPEYNSTSKEYDLALLKLDRNATITAAVMTLGLLPMDHLVDQIVSKKCRTGGFGYVVPGVTDLVRLQSQTLKQDMIQRRSDEACTGIPSTGFCLESRINSTWLPCEGDVGSPIICKRKRVWLIGGIISGFNIANGCAGPEPKVGTPTSYGIDWATETMANN